MIDIRKYIVDTIRNCTGLPCYYLAPPKEAEFPCVVYNEVTNRDYALALGNEYANIAYNFTVYSQEPTDIFTIVNNIDDTMKAEGFTKDYSSPDMYYDEVYSKTIRMKAIINHKGEIFH